MRPGNFLTGCISLFVGPSVYPTGKRIVKVWSVVVAVAVVVAGVVAAARVEVAAVVVATMARCWSFPLLSTGLPQQFFFPSP